MWLSLTQNDVLNKIQRYQHSLQQIEGITSEESDLIANLANITAVLRQQLGYYWIGFYLVWGDELVVGPFQGTPACVRIGYGKGVCGHCWKQAETQLVPDVHDFPGHIACDPHSASEIVVPVFDKAGEVAMVLDVDHTERNTFDETDRQYLEKLATYITTLL